MKSEERHILKTALQALKIPHVRWEKTKSIYGHTEHRLYRQGYSWPKNLYEVTLWYNNSRKSREICEAIAKNLRDRGFSPKVVDDYTVRLERNRITSEEANDHIRSMAKRIFNQ